MRDHHDRLLELAVELFQQVEDLAAGGAVEVAGRLVGDQEVGVGDDGPGDRHALLLAAGELARVMMLAAGQADDSQRRHDVLAPLAPRQVREQERQLDVLERRQDRDQVIGLEDEADVVGPPAGDLRLGEVAQVLAVHDHLAAGGPVEPGDQVQERGLARARGAHERQELPFADGKIEVDQNRNPELVASVFLVEHRARRSRTFRPWTMNLSRSDAGAFTRSIRTISNSRRVFDRAQERPRRST